MTYTKFTTVCRSQMKAPSMPILASPRITSWCVPSISAQKQHPSIMPDTNGTSHTEALE